MIQFMTSVTVLHVSAPEYNPQGVYYDKGVKVQYARY